jgi:hypothetical protein
MKFSWLNFRTPLYTAQTGENHKESETAGHRAQTWIRHLQNAKQVCYPLWSVSIWITTFSGIIWIKITALSYELKYIIPLKRTLIRLGLANRPTWNDFFLGATVPIRPGPPHSRGFQITHNDAPQSVGSLWTCDQLVAETSTWQHLKHSQ